MDDELLLEPGPSPPWRHHSLPGGYVMLHSERSPVSRVRAIRTHGLKGGLAAIRSTEEG